MQGLMQDWPLLIHRILDHAAIQHARRPVLSRSVEGPMHATTYAELRRRALRLAKRLDRDGIRRGDRVATLAWNTWRHLESWYGIAGIGAVYHTVNPRLFEDQIVYIVNHAGDRMMLLDLTFVPLVERLQERMPTVERYVVLTDAAHMPETRLKGAVAYEDWIGEVDDDFAWAALDENEAAGMCYTSGTTGEPKGVVYSHRSNVLHALAANNPDYLGLSCRDVVMPVVPLFHANGWALAFAAPMAGAGLVLPGPRLDGASIHGLLEEGRVTCTAAVPTVWLALLQHLDGTGATLSTLKRVVIGGSACPRAMTVAFETRYGVRVSHAWGMTEMSPLGSFCSIKPDYGDISGEALFDLKVKQGHPPFTVEFRITDDAGRDLPWDGLDAQGYFDTGDVATIDQYGTMHITDRSKDVIKSGGEWISSIEIENLAVGHPDVAEAAVIGIAHPKWDERPLLVVVPKEGRRPTKDELLAFLQGRIARWWMPDDVVLVDQIPHTATGKIQKTALRDLFKDYRLPTG
jgi:acyl-CoA synthetase (AMP-forming)/AMP-acid ligase II